MRWSAIPQGDVSSNQDCSSEPDLFSGSLSWDNCSLVNARGFPSVDPECHDKTFVLGKTVLPSCEHQDTFFKFHLAARY